MDLATRRLLAVLLACVAVFTLSGFFLKAQCIGHYNELRDKTLCSNDIQFLYGNRHLDQHQFPYLHGGLVQRQYSDGTPYDDLTGGTLEYPVLTGIFAWFPSVFVSNDGDYLRLTALLLAPFSFLTAFLLSRMVKWRAILYAAAPPLVWYSFHNWDLLVVAATVGAFYAWWKQRYAWSAAWLAVGACLKFWPLFFVLPLLLDRLAKKDSHHAAWVLASFSLVFGALNGFFALVNRDGWWAPYAFQQHRAADITSNSIWYWGFPDLTTDDLNTLIPILLVVGALIACGVGWWRSGREGEFPFVQVCGALLAVFMLTNKAHSPQYALWLLPFFCLLRLRWGWWAAYMLIDIAMYVGIFRWFYDLSQGKDFGLAKQALVIGVWGRAVMLVLLFVVMLRSRTALEPATAPA